MSQINYPLCFVLIPYGKIHNKNKSIVNFDNIYKHLLFPSITNANLKPLRANRSSIEGSYDKSIFEYFILSEFAIVDLSHNNANLFYEIGIRNALRPNSTVFVYDEFTSKIDFSTDPFRAISYNFILDSKLNSERVSRSSERITQSLLQAKITNKDTLLYQIVEDFCGIQHLKTDVFRERVKYDEILKNRLKEIRKNGDIQSLKNIIFTIGDIKFKESSSIVDIFLSYRALAKKKEEWEDMLSFVYQIPEPLADTTLIQEQYAFALNRSGYSEKAEKVLIDLLSKKGSSSETYGLLGRVYKDRWKKAIENKEFSDAEYYLKKSINTYIKGFETDFRDTYPGINALNLISIQNPKDQRINQMFPVVRYAVERRISNGEPNYWDYATLLELAIFSEDESLSKYSVGKALSLVSENWEIETTLQTILMMITHTQKSQSSLKWINEIIDMMKKDYFDLQYRT